MTTFDPNGTGQSDSGIFALPFTPENSELIVIPVPWDVTTSYGKGTSRGPESILASSKQLDLCHPHFGDFYKRGIFMETPSQEWLQTNARLGLMAKDIQAQRERGAALSEEQEKNLEEINKASMELNQWLESRAAEVLTDGKVPVAVGGDHSSPYGLIKTLKAKHSDLSILHIDAHCDLRFSYQGFQHSHASIMRNVMEDLEPSHLVQIGIRDYCPEEKDFSKAHGKITTHFDAECQLRLHQGETWQRLCQEFLRPLSKTVYISFDVDGLTPDLCPGTGTPVPGGLNFPQVQTLLRTIKESGLNVVGFDLCEVSPDPKKLDGWDGNVGARLLYMLCGIVLETSQSL